MSLAENASELVDRMILVGRSRESERRKEINLLKKRLGREIEIPSEVGSDTIPVQEAAYKQLTGTVVDLRRLGEVADAVRADTM